MDSASIKDISNIPIPDDIPVGDMPGDNINIADGQIQRARILFPEVIRLIKEEPAERIVISLSGGSGSGKSGIASVLAYLLGKAGLPSYIMSGDNYPRRIPSANDNERLHIFRQSGIRGLVGLDMLTPEVLTTLRRLQQTDCDSIRQGDGTFVLSDWFGKYLFYGTCGLREYLGTPAEIDFAEVDAILKDFRLGASDIWFKRMGRDEASLWYEKVDVRDTKVLILEWTHGCSDCLSNVDIPVMLCSTPEETLENRLSRGRDDKIDSPFTTLILDLEQELLNSQAGKARIILTREGHFISYEEYKEIMK